MIEKVKIIAKNPMAASSGEMENAGVLSVMQKNTKVNLEEAELETNVLE